MTFTHKDLIEVITDCNRRITSIDAQIRNAFSNAKTGRPIDQEWLFKAYSVSERLKNTKAAAQRDLEGFSSVSSLRLTTWVNSHFIKIAREKIPKAQFIEIYREAEKRAKDYLGTPVKTKSEDA